MIGHLLRSARELHTAAPFVTRNICRARKMTKFESTTTRWFSFRGMRRTEEPQVLQLHASPTRSRSDLAVRGW